MEKIDKVALIYLRNSKILSTRSKGKKNYYLPGGKRENMETDQQTLKREIMEELNVNLLPETMSYYGTFEAQADEKPDGVTVKMTCYTADYIGDTSPSSEIEEIKWLSFADIDRVSCVDKLIFNELHKKGLLN